jgi:hypothetical protein
MLADARLRELGVEVIGRAVAEREMVAPFHVLRADYSTPNYQRGRSSMYPAVVAAEHLEVVEVPTVRLDAFLASRMDPGARLRSGWTPKAWPTKPSRARRVCARISSSCMSKWSGSRA